MSEATLKKIDATPWEILRQNVLNKITETMQQSKQPQQFTATMVENHLFQMAKEKKRDYVLSVGRVIADMLGIQLDANLHVINQPPMPMAGGGAGMQGTNRTVGAMGANQMGGSMPGRMQPGQPAMGGVAGGNIVGAGNQGQMQNPTKRQRLLGAEEMQQGADQQVPQLNLNPMGGMEGMQVAPGGQMNQQNNVGMNRGAGSMIQMGPGQVIRQQPPPGVNPNQQIGVVGGQMNQMNPAVVGGPSGNVAQVPVLRPGTVFKAVREKNKKNQPLRYEAYIPPSSNQPEVENDIWKTASYRQYIAKNINEALLQVGNKQSKTGSEVECEIFRMAGNSSRYHDLVSKRTFRIWGRMQSKPENEQMAEDNSWKTVGFRQHVVNQINATINHQGGTCSRSGQQLEAQFFLDAIFKDEYVSAVNNFIEQVRRIQGLSNQQQQQQQQPAAEVPKKSAKRKAGAD